MDREYTVHSFRPPAELQIDYAAELNPQQLAAVTARPGPALVIAGAGSGKTRTLTYRVAYLLEHGVPASGILLLTFTNKAAREMMRRATTLIHGDHTSLWGGTFHSVGARLLRRHAELLGYRPDYTILDRDDAVKLVKACLADAKIETKGGRFPKAEVVAEIFSMAVNKRESLPSLLKDRHDLTPAIRRQLDELAAAYARRKQAANVMDFDDLLALWLKLLEDFPDLRERYQRQFQFILVDEYQDTNKLQSDLIDTLAARHKNLMVVGDDSQSIYAWRGAEYRNILDFPKRYPAAHVYKIELNYRSTPEILAVANAAIAGNPEQFQKKLKAVRPGGAKPAVVACMDARQQSAFVAQRAKELHEEGRPYKEMAVLYRSHFHAMELQLELTRQGVPFTITSGLRIFEQAHIKDIIAFLKLVYNPSDEPSFKRLTLMLPGVGEKAADKLWVHYYQAWPAVTNWDQAAAQVATEDAAGAPPFSTAESLAKCSPFVPRKAATDWVALLGTFRKLEAEVSSGPSSMISIILDGGYEDYLEANYPKATSRMDDLEQLADFATQFESLADFLTQLSLLTNLEAEATQGERVLEEEDRLRMTTVHQAKGLEWDVVFAIMLCENMFPSFRALEAGQGEAEERRLFYVAVTRARSELYLCFPQCRFMPGQGGDFNLEPSRFLREIPPHLLDKWRLSQFADF